MAQEIIQAGPVQIQLGISAGVASIGVVAADTNSGTAANLSVTQNATPVVQAIFSLLEKISPAGLVPIEEGAKTAILANLNAIT